MNSDKFLSLFLGLFLAISQQSGSQTKIEKKIFLGVSQLVRIAPEGEGYILVNPQSIHADVEGRIRDTRE